LLEATDLVGRRLPKQAMDSDVCWQILVESLAKQLKTLRAVGQSLETLSMISNSIPKVVDAALDVVDLLQN
jgi:hypothetical protein